MQIVGILDYGLAKIADLMIKHVINPTISKGSVNICIEELDESPVGLREAMLKLLPSSEYEVCAAFQSYIILYSFKFLLSCSLCSTVSLIC